MSPSSLPRPSTPPAITSIKLLKQYLDFDGDEPSSQLHDQLSNLLRRQEFRDFILGLECHDLAWFVEFLDNILSTISDSTSHTFQGFLHELKGICGAREILPGHYTIPDRLLNVSRRVATGHAREGVFKGSKVCVKEVVIRCETDMEKARETFYQTTVLWRHLSHPNIVPLLGSTTNPLQFISEWMPGGNLTAYTVNHPNVDRFGLLSDIAEGLNYLHSWNIVHGNFKGSNVLVDDAGRARITDFGLAPVTRSPDFAQHADEDHGVQWTAPEILDGRGTYSKEADVFSFAMVTIEAFTDSTPFSDEQPHTVISGILDGTRPPRPAHRSFTDWLWALMQHCWDSEASQRPQMSQVLQVLHQFGRSAWNRLITGALTPCECSSLVATIFSDRNEVEGVKDLCGNDAQAFIDAIDQVLDDPTLPLRKRCVKTLCKICGNLALLPSSLQIPLCYDSSGRALYSGGYADVWKGQHQGYGVAVKVLRVYSSSDFDKIKSRFCKEVVTWRALRHPNVLQLLGATMTDHKFAMSSKWMTNGNINEFLERHKDADRLKLLKGVANGLRYLHSQGMIHGDLKGANILIDEDENALLADFGLLTLVSDPSNPTASNSHACAGTMRWMSPELLDPDQFGPKDGRPTKESDRYALGMVIYEVLSGKVPFAPYREYVVMRKVIEGERPERPEGEEGARFTDNLWQTLQRCWAQESRGRPGIDVILGCLEPAPTNSAVSILENPLANPPSPQFDGPPEIIIEALRTKFRSFVLRLGEQMEALINERGTRIVVNPTAVHERLLARRCSTYYRLGCENNTESKDMLIYRMADSKVPPRRIAELVPLEENAPLASSVGHHVREDRTEHRRVVDEDDDLSDSDRSETENHSGQGDASGSGGHREEYMTIDERVARIVKDCEDREKPKETSARGSSTSSQVSDSDTIWAIKDGGVRAFTTGSPLSSPVTQGANQSGDTIVPAHPPWPPDYGESSPPPVPAPFSYPGNGLPPLSPHQSQYLGYPPTGYTGADMYTYYPPFPGQALEQDAVPQHPYQHSLPYQQQPLVDPTLPSTGEPAFYPRPHSQSQHLPYSSQSPWSHIPGHAPQQPRAQNNIPTSSNCDDDYPATAGDSPRTSTGTHEATLSAALRRLGLQPASGSRDTTIPTVNGTTPTPSPGPFISATPARINPFARSATLPTQAFTSTQPHPPASASADLAPPTTVPRLLPLTDSSPWPAHPSSRVPSLDSGLLNPRGLFVENLDGSTTSIRLFARFCPYGPVVSARVMRDEAGRSRGYGFVMFETPDQASAAIRATNGAFFEGKQIRVRFHEPGPIRPGETPRNQKQRSRSYYQAPSPFVGLNGLYGVPDTFASP